MTTQTSPTQIVQTQTDRAQAVQTPGVPTQGLQTPGPCQTPTPSRPTGARPRTPNEIIVRFNGVRRLIAAKDANNGWSFGRKGDLVIDDGNRYLHRKLGEFRFDGSRWWLHNTGSSINLSLHINANNVQAVLTPGSALPVGVGEFTLTFTAGPRSYALDGATTGHAEPIDADDPRLLDGEPTAQWGQVELNDDQRLLLTALAEQHLLNPTHPSSAVPTNRQLALRLGWTITKYNRKLDHLCDKLHRAGVSGIRGEAGEVAADRRQRLLEHCLTYGVVTIDDLPRLDARSRR